LGCIKLNGSGLITETWPATTRRVLLWLRVLGGRNVLMNCMLMSRSVREKWNFWGCRLTWSIHWPNSEIQLTDAEQSRLAEMFEYVTRNTKKPIRADVVLSDRGR